jgi:signal peptidase II
MIKCKHLSCYLVFITVVVLDQLSKWWILTDVMNPPAIIPLTDFFNLVLSFNRGISFGMLSSDYQMMAYVLSGVAVVISIGFLVWMHYAETRLLAFGLAMTAGGAIGNVIDRLRFGAVVDFLDFYVSDYHWPAFNFADSAITLGVGFILIDTLIASMRK